MALGLSKILNRRSFELNLVSAIGENEKTSVIQTVLEENNINTKYLLIKGNQNDQYLSIETKMEKYLDQLIPQVLFYPVKVI